VRPNLAIVVPVFDEERCIETVLREWQPAVSEVEPNYCFLSFDDGSTDRTRALIDGWAALQKPGTCHVVSRPNVGHGQTCLEGYRAACDLGAEWILQIDSDGQCDPKYFAELWAKRHGHDVVYGKRVKRMDGWKRVLATKLVRLVVHFASGADCIDANVPYRLMRTQHLRPLVDSIPPDFDLANIALAVQIKRVCWREAVVPIVFRRRAGGEASVPLKRFAAKARELIAQLKSLPQSDAARS
jgi:dolichol-phosphate mannosyltransferase